MSFTAQNDEICHISEASTAIGIRCWVGPDSNHLCFNKGSGQVPLGAADSSYEICSPLCHEDEPPAADISVQLPNGYRIENGAKWHQSRMGTSKTDLVSKIPVLGLCANLGVYREQNNPDLVTILPWIG